MSESDDTFRTVVAEASGQYSEKRSRFVAHVFPVKSVEEAKAILDEYRKRYYDARHVCWAYMLGPERKIFRQNDDGEPSGTAGRPILGQINSHELTDVLVLVARYFGGILLGTSRLAVAYRTAAAEAIAAASIEERTVDETIRIACDYPFLDKVMRIIKEESPEVLSRQFEMRCEMVLSIRRSKMANLKERLRKVESAEIKDL